MCTRLRSIALAGTTAADPVQDFGHLGLEASAFTLKRRSSDEMRLCLLPRVFHGRCHAAAICFELLDPVCLRIDVGALAFAGMSRVRELLLQPVALSLESTYLILRMGELRRGRLRREFGRTARLFHLLLRMFIWPESRPTERTGPPWH